MLSLKQELQSRDLYYQCTNEQCFEYFEQGGKKFYIGYDPTADSLTIGNFCTLMAALQFMKRGNTFVVIIWGATGMIGDPSGRDSERNFLDETTLRYNQQAIKEQIEGIMTNISSLTGYIYNIEVLNNYDFYKDMNALEYLRSIGKYITVNSMITKDSISRRLTDGNFISYTEFSYTLLQGYDFVHLNKHHGVTLQLGASDQRGNITTGTEMIRKMTDNEAYGFTFPLVLDSTGKKFGKSEGNAIWLDPKKNSPWICYNYFMNVSDEDVERYLKIFTLLSLEGINKIRQEHQQDLWKRYGQKRLAQEITTIIYWKEYTYDCQKTQEILFWNENLIEAIQDISIEQAEMVAKAIWYIDTPLNMSVIDILVESGLSSSRWEAKKDILANAISINNNKIWDIQYVITHSDFIAHMTRDIAVIQKWKKNKKILFLKK